MKILSFARYAAFVGNTLAWVIGMVTLSVLLYVTNFRSTILYTELFKNYVILMGVAGFLIYLSGFFGCCGSVRVNKNTMKAFLYLGGLTLLALVAFGIYLAINFKSSIEESVWQSLTNNQRTTIEQELECCFSPASMVGNEPLPLNCFSYEKESASILVFRGFKEVCEDKLGLVADLATISFACILGSGILFLTIGLMGIGKLHYQLRYQEEREKLRKKHDETDEEAEKKF